MQDNHIDGEATNLWTERRAVEAKGGPDEEGGRGVMHEGTPVTRRHAGVFWVYFVSVWCVCACCRASVQPRKPARQPGVGTLLLLADAAPVESSVR